MVLPSHAAPTVGPNEHKLTLSAKQTGFLTFLQRVKDRVIRAILYCLGMLDHVVEPPKLLKLNFGCQINNIWQKGLCFIFPHFF